jgi:Flp pilus assembly protein TadD
MLSYLASWLRGNMGMVVLLIATFCIYIPSLSGEFVIDDVIFIQDNPYIKDFGYVTRFFTEGLWENSALEVDTEAMYRPMNLAPFLLEYALWGVNPVGYHAFLLLLHLANVCLVYLLVRKLANTSVLAATLGAAVFALHPTRVESVAWISGGIDPLVTFFLLTALLAHLSFFADGENVRKWYYFTVSLFCFQLALWSKEVAIIFPIIVIAYDWIYKKNINWPTVFAHIAIVAAYLIARGNVLGSTGKWNDLDLTHFSKAIDFGLGYVEMLLFPAYIPLYIQPPEQAVSSGMGMLGVILISLMLGYGWKVAGAKARKTVVFSAIWTIGFFWPAVLLAFYTNGFYAGRFLYVPALGATLLAAFFYDYLNVTYPRWKTAFLSAGIVLIGCYGFMTGRDISAWHDKGTIYGKIVQDSPENAVGYVALGDFYLGQEDYVMAEKNFLLAVEKAKTPRSSVSALVNLGTINGMNNKLDQSETYLKEAVKIDPKSSEGWAGLGNLAQMRGNYTEAISFYEKAIANNPKNYEATMNLAVAYDKTGQFQRGELLRRNAASIPH